MIIQPRPLYVLGVDPGATTGLAMLAWNGSIPHVVGVATVRDLGEHESQITLATLLHLGGLPEDRLDVVLGVEVPVGHAYGEWKGTKVADLVACAYLGGRIVGANRGAYAMPAAKWRRSLCGVTGPTDQRIKLALEPVLHASGIKRSNAHERDAIGVALYTRALHRMGAKS